MTKDRKMIYSLSAVIFAVLLSCLFIPSEISSKVIAASVLLPLAVLTSYFIKKRTTPSVNRRLVLLILSVSAAIYVSLYYVSGAVFGLYKFPALTVASFFESVVPISLVIVSIEIIRFVILAQKRKASSVLIYLAGVAADALIFSTLVGIKSFSVLMDVLGLYLFPAVTANLLYNYISKRYGAYPNIAYRLIVSLHLYFIPVKSAMPDAILSLAKILFPLLILIFVDAIFEKKRRFATVKKSKLRFVGIGVILIFMVSLVMIISNRFTFGVYVIATPSMTGEINKGDVIIYERYDGDDPIELGDIIVYKDGNSEIIHRVVNVKKINGQTQYYTKGDANENVDYGYVTGSDIIGKVKFKIAYIGYPSLLVRELFSK